MSKGPMTNSISEAGFSFAYTPATPKEGLVDFLNLTERDGKLRVSARQGNVPPNGQYVQFDLPIEALSDLRKALSRASQPVEPKGPFATHGSGAALNTSGGQTYAMSTPPLDTEAVERLRAKQSAITLALKLVDELGDWEPHLLEQLRSTPEAKRLAALLSLAKPIRTGCLPTSADVGVVKPVGGKAERVLKRIRAECDLASSYHSAKALGDNIAMLCDTALTAMKEDDRGEGMVDE